jgi:hypothetical protein
VYYLPGKTGWSSSFDGLPSVLWNPLVLITGHPFGSVSNKFAFVITNKSDLTVVVKACSNLYSPDWVPLQTVTLTNGFYYFDEILQTNVINRYYGLGLP